MSEGVFLSPRVAPPSTTDQTTCRQFAKTTAFGTAGVVVSCKPGRLYQAHVVNKAGATAYYVQLHDKAIAPVNTNVPVWEMKVAAVSDVHFDFGLAGLAFTNGIGIALSSTSGILTLAGSADATAYGLFAAVVAPPVVTSVAPATDVAAGGEAITITGSGFGGATGGTLGGTALTSFVVVSDTSITAVAPAHAVGTVDLAITGVGSSGIGVGKALFVYTA